MTPFFDISPDELREWRQNPVTKAFMALLREQAEGRRSAAMASIKGENFNQAAVDAGHEEGLLRAIDLGERTR